MSVSESTRLISKDEMSSKDSYEKGNVATKNMSGTIAALSFTLLVQSYLLISVFPYSGFLAMHLMPQLDEENAGGYAGFIAASFMIGRTFSSFEWGKAADRFGRVSVIKTSLLLSAVFSILFGLAPTFPMALISRFLLGVCNGILGPVKTLISEYACGDKNKEIHMMAIIFGSWGFGFLINPAISGYLSDPVEQYPDASFVRILRPILEEFPFFLPNLVGCFFCLVGFVLIHNFVDETLPEEKRQLFRIPSVMPCIKTTMRNLSSWGLFKHEHISKGEISDDLVAPFQDIGGQGTEEDIENESESVTIYSLLKREGTRQHLMVYWSYSFLMVAIDEVFPLYCISKTSGLGITEKLIGKLLSGTGLLFIFLQYFVAKRMVDHYGFYKSLRIGAFLSVPLGVFIPISLLTNEGARDGTLTLTSLVYLSALYAVIRCFSAVVFSTITMTLNRTVPDLQRGAMNGLCMLGGSLAKAIGPLFGGILFSSSVSHFTPPFGSVIVYIIIAALGICLGLQVYFLRECDVQEKQNTETKENK